MDFLLGFMSMGSISLGASAATVGRKKAVDITGR